jgi:hypothetical protein
MVRFAAALTFLFLHSSIALAGRWSVQLPSTNPGDAIVSEQTLGCELAGTSQRFGSAFMKLNFTSCSGTNCAQCYWQNPNREGPSGITIHGIELPGFGFWGEHILGLENRLINSIATGGACPGVGGWGGTYMFLAFDPKALPNTRRLQALFGSFRHEYETSTSTILDAYSINDSAGQPTYPAINLGPGLALTGTCSDGVTTVVGAGDRGGKVFASPNAGAIFASNGNKMVYVLPRFKIPSLEVLDGGWAGFIYKNAGVPNPAEPATKTIIKPTPVRFPNSLITGFGYRILDVATHTLDAEDRWNIEIPTPYSETFNKPLNGVFKMSLAHTKNGVNVSRSLCGLYFFAIDGDVCR